MSNQNFRFLRFSKNSIFATKTSKFRSHEKACLFFYNSLDSKRRELIFTEDQAMTHLNWSILRIFHLRSSIASKSTENTDFFQNARGQVVEQIALSRYYSSVQPLHESCPYHKGARARSERPPAGPEKYTKVFGNDKSNQNFRFLMFSKKSMFATKI